jgi:hypothetical protein
MHHKRLVIALILLLLATGSSMAGVYDQWFTIGSLSQTPPPGPPYMVSGGLENGRELYVCRAAVGNVILPGKTWSGLNGCFVAQGGEMLITPYQVLAQPPFVSDYNFTYHWATRTEMIANPGLWNLAVQGGIEAGSSIYVSDYRICSRDLFVNGAYVGRHPGRLINVPPSDWCVVTWGGQQYYAQDWSVLLYAHD